MNNNIFKLSLIDTVKQLQQNWPLLLDILHK